MSDKFIDALRRNEVLLSNLDNEAIMCLAMSEILSEFAVGNDVPPRLKAKRISLSAELTKRAGVKF